MSYQGFFPKAIFPDIPTIGEISGLELINATVSCNLSHYKELMVLPLLTIKEDKGTGVVTSVPAEAPDDYVAFMEVINTQAILDKYNINVRKLNKYDTVNHICLILNDSINDNIFNKI